MCHTGGILVSRFLWHLQREPAACGQMNHASLTVLKASAFALWERRRQFYTGWSTIPSFIAFVFTKAERIL